MSRDGTRTRAAIIRCMREEFLTCGYDKASLNRISANVGITTAGLYKHFNGKEDMFHFLVKDALAAFQLESSQAEAEMGASADYDPFDTDWARIWIDLIYEHHEGVKLLICRSRGSRFESFEDDLIRKEAEGNKEFARSRRESGGSVGDVSDSQWYMLSATYIHLIFETVRRDMTREEAIAHMGFIRELLYPGWRRILALERG